MRRLRETADSRYSYSQVQLRNYSARNVLNEIERLQQENEIMKRKMEQTAELLKV